jgi:assimilatory nitrate reductase catalytic subunit
VVSDCIAATDTSFYAQVKLPASGWGEKDGTVTNSERRVSRQRGFMTPPGEAKPDWWAIAEVAKRMGFAGFDYPDAASIFREFAAQTGFENDGARVLDISDKADMSNQDYDAMAPFQWGGASPFATRRYATPDGKARMVPVRHVPRDDGNRAFPLRLNTGRYRDQWHSMTRTGLSPKLSQHRREPLVEMHPDTVQRLGLTDGGLARVQTAQGSSIFRVATTPDQRRRELFVPIHWTDQTSGGGRAGLLPARDRDPVSGQPGFKNTPATATPYRPGWSGFLLSRDLPAKPDCAYWTRIRTASGWLTELAGDGDIAPLTALLPGGERAEMIDPKRGVIRSAVMAGGMLRAALFVSRSGGLPPRDWLIAQLGQADAAPFELLAGRPATPVPDRGRIVCVCFDIGLNTILDAIAGQRLVSVEAVGAAINAGTNCGSCRPAIAALLPPQKEAAYG